MKVVVICEDFRKDQYIAKPIVEAMLKFLRAHPIVVVAKEPLLRGVSEVMNWNKLQLILDRYRGMARLFVLLVDRDGDEKRRQALAEIERKARSYVGLNACFMAENAWQELEVWALAAQALPPAWAWKDVRSDPHPKERYFDTLAEQRGLSDEPGEGRQTMGVEAAKDYARVRALCKEDVGSLEARVKRLLEEGTCE